VTASRNIPVFDDLPVPADTANLREGANLNDALLALLPLVGVWRGEGEGRGADGDYRFGQQVSVSHDGGDYLNWESRSWRISDTGDYQGPGLRETGYWRFVSDADDFSESQAIELLLAHSAGYVELFYGRPLNQRGRRGAVHQRELFNGRPGGSGRPGGRGALLRPGRAASQAVLGRDLRGAGSASADAGRQHRHRRTRRCGRAVRPAGK
jgi:hypothetical protein